MKRSIMILCFALIWCGFLSAQIGPNVSVDKNGHELKWEVGSHDYFVLFKSILANNDRTNDTEPNKAYNPQADACITEQKNAVFTLSNTHIPGDAWIENAQLIWMSHSDEAPASTVNKVVLHFTGAEGQPAYSQDIFSLVSGLGQPYKSFEYEFVKDTLTSSSVYTYRTDITDIIRDIQVKGREAGITPDGKTLYGSWSVSGIECFTSGTLIDKKSMIGAWALVLVYNSEKIRPKKIYFYNGLQGYLHNSGNLTVQGFELPTAAEIRLTLMMAEGDPGLFVGPPVYNTTEAFNIAGSTNTDWITLTNACNPMRQAYTETYNSVSSMFGWDSAEPVCVGGDPDVLNPDILEYGIDVDTFMVKASDPPFDSHLHFGDTSFKLAIHANQDMVFSNLLIVSVESKAPKFDIPVNPDTPDGREKRACSCSKQPDSFCLNSPFYYLIKLQNWGDNSATQVSVEDSLPEFVDYISGTTEFATLFDGSGNGTDWQKVEDDAGAFPFSSVRVISEMMNPCDSVSMSCDDTILIRFKVKPKPELPKHAVITNIAGITDSTGAVYRTNSDVALRIKVDTACQEGCEPSKEDCGGVCSDPSCSGETVNDDTKPADKDNATDNSNLTPENDAFSPDSEQINPESEGDSGCGCSML